MQLLEVEFQDEDDRRCRQPEHPVLTARVHTLTSLMADAQLLAPQLATLSSPAATTAKRRFAIGCAIANFVAKDEVILLDTIDKNWKQLEKSPHVWFVNICRIG